MSQTTTPYVCDECRPKKTNWYGPCGHPVPAAPAMSVEKLREAQGQGRIEEHDHHCIRTNSSGTLCSRGWNCERREYLLAALAQEAEQPAGEHSVSQLRKALERIAALPLGSHEPKQIANIALAAQELREEAAQSVAEPLQALGKLRELLESCMTWTTYDEDAAWQVIYSNEHKQTIRVSSRYDAAMAHAQIRGIVMDFVRRALAQSTASAPEQPVGKSAAETQFINDVKLALEFTQHEEPCNSEPCTQPCSCGLAEVRQRVAAYIEQWHREGGKLPGGQSAGGGNV